jgi:histidinol phosphatase-like enzyme
VQKEGARISSSHLCFHRAEDGCRCRKPETGLLEEAFARNPGIERASSWMVGDGVSDVEAGSRLALRTAFLGPRKCDACRIFEDRKLAPTLWASDLAELVSALITS